MPLSGRSVGNEATRNVSPCGSSSVNRLSRFFRPPGFCFFGHDKVTAISQRVSATENVVPVPGKRIWIARCMVLTDRFGSKRPVKAIGRYNLVNGSLCFLPCVGPTRYTGSRFSRTRLHLQELLPIQFTNLCTLFIYRSVAIFRETRTGASPFFAKPEPERRHFSRNPKWGPSDFGCKKSGDGHGLRRPTFTFVLRSSRRALRAAPGLPQ